MTRQADVVIVGGGPAGMAAAIWCKRLSLDHLLIESGRSLGGQLFAIHNRIIDYPGLLAENGQEVQAVFARHLQELHCTQMLDAKMQAVDVAERRLTVRASAAESDPLTVTYRGLILATGSAVRRLGVPGEKDMLARGELYSAVRDSKRFAGKRVAVVGGGDRAVEGALLLAESGAEVVLIHRSDQFRARQSLLQPMLGHPQIEVLTFATVEEIAGERAVESVLVRLADGRKQRVAVEALFVRIGVEPNSRAVRGQVQVDADGYVVTDAVGQTSFPGVFAVGDVCTRPLFSSIASAVGQGMVAAKQLSLLLAEPEKEGHL